VSSSIHRTWIADAPIVLQGRIVDYFWFALAYEPAGAALAPGSRLVRKAIWPVW
jgi:hypothetical protein